MTSEAIYYPANQYREIDTSDSYHTLHLDQACASICKTRKEVSNVFPRY